MSGETSRARGRSRELRVLDHFRSEGWVTYRLAWGNADVMAARMVADVDGVPPRMQLLLVQVKSTGAGPYDHFRPMDRDRLVAEAQACGAEAVLAFWPKGGRLTFIPSAMWPRRQLVTA